MERIRQAIEQGRYPAFVADYLSGPAPRPAA
jgi:hypothetical protein